MNEQTETTNPSSSLREAVGAQIATISPTVADKVTATFVKREIDKRSDAIVRGLDQLDTIERDLNKINRADVTTFNGDGTVASETYSKQRIDDIGKAKQRRDKLVKALDKALNGDMGDLYNLLNAGGKQES